MSTAEHNALKGYCPHCMRASLQDVCSWCGKPRESKQNEMFLQPGTVLKGHYSAYLLGVRLGSGGFGATYIALEKESGKRVCVKEFFPVQCVIRGSQGRVLIKRGQENAFAGGKESFAKEAALLMTLKDNPSVVRVWDCFEQNQTVYLVMDYLEGDTLLRRVQRGGAMKPEELLPLLRTLIADMQKMHDKGVIHRDIAPDNVILTNEGRLMLIDFGSARLYEDGKSMTVQLKDGFAPVEQYTSRSDQGPWTDVYALCATAYYCLTKTVLHMAPERLENDEMIPVGNLAPTLKKAQARAIQAGLAVQPLKRTRTMNALSNALFMSSGQRKWQKLRSILRMLAGK